MRRTWLRVSAWCLAVAVLVSAGSALAADGEFNGFKIVHLIVDGEPIDPDVPAVNFFGRTVVPLRTLATMAGFDIQWDASTSTAQLTSRRAGPGTAQLQSENAQLKSDLDAARSELSKARTASADADSLRSDNTTLKSEKSALQTDLDKANGRIQELEARASQPATAPATSQTSVEQLAAQLKSKVFRVDVCDSIGTKTGSGSAVAVGTSEVVTNYHVVAEAASANLIDDGGRTLAVLGLTAYDRGQDLAVLRVGEMLQPVPLRTTPAKIGEEVVAIGSPIGLTNTVSTGIVSAGRTYQGIEVIQVTAPISPGSSGGGLFDRQGQLLGITFASYTDGQNLNFAIPITYMQPLVAAGRVGAVQKLPGLSSVTAANLVETVRRLYPSFQAGTRTVTPTFELIKRTAPTGNSAPAFFSVDMDITQYLEYLKGMIVGDFQASRDAVDSYLQTIGKLMLQAYPGKDVDVNLYHVATYISYPTSYNASEVSLQGNGRWLVIHRVAMIYYQGSKWYHDWN